MSTRHNRLGRILEKSWPVWLGAIILGFLACFYFAFGKTVGVQTSLLYWGAWVGEYLGLDPASWNFFQGSQAKALAGGFWRDAGSILTLGVVAGSLLAALSASEFRLRKITSRKQLLAAVLGGLLMGYGGRVAGTCNLGVYFGLLPSQSLSGWVFLVFVGLGAGLGSWLLWKYFT